MRQVTTHHIAADYYVGSGVGRWPTLCGMDIWSDDVDWTHYAGSLELLEENGPFPNCLQCLLEAGRRWRNQRLKAMGLMIEKTESLIKAFRGRRRA